MLIAVALTACVGCKRTPPQPDLPKLGSIGTFSLTDQAGKPFTPEQLKGQVWLANFFFTSCPTVCPRMTKKMREVQAQGAAKNLEFHLVSVSVDPETDTPKVLTEYAKENQADTANWSFLTGDFEVIKKTSVEGFKMALDGKLKKDADHFGILHGSHLVLIDQKGEIRGFYRSADDDAVKRLLQDIARLSKG